ncbi:BON domain-containing protein [Magnetospirillum molischianum]|uniref:Predicted periplasmic or secreted lipoprotein n=1 Tax=Magnetospirillum molischianum DSM 120 TaxID=1150626 RepID=H8FPP9_MAGML|nr:BON domain-containing protein [Magnetospirillum molischianum]CCG40337.1 Predicted periplasmic or secreted lipoprotein [Magnetospirillum molischianum DSM 120]
MWQRGPVEIVLALALILPVGCAPFGDAAGPGVSTPASGLGIVVRPGDETMASMVRTKLAETDRDSFQGVSVLVWNGTALLTGAVIRPEQRHRAEQTARAVPGIVEVHDELQLAEKAALNSFAPDTKREADILAQLSTHPNLTGSFTLRMVHGVAYLLGSAPSRAEAENAADLIRDIEGVKWVVDHVTVTNGS